MKALIYQLIKFGIVGILATVLDGVIYYTLVNVVGMHYLFATVIAFVLATVFNYWASMKYVFTSQFGAQQKGKEAFIFVALSVVSLGLTLSLMWLFVERLGWSANFAKIPVTVFVMGFSFVTRKLLIEGKGGR
ncbi:MAG: GtrA family protein [Aerococcaceae bacterium]|nr:GtrA family protein [Aerococcaceae bacterium]